VKFQLLPSTFDENGSASPRQHLSCFIINDSVAIDAGSLAMGTSFEQKQKIRHVVLTHAHLDHIAGLPLFLDDLFATLTEPVKIYAERAVIEILERDIFNWDIYPRFSELSNENGAIMEYIAFERGREFCVGGLRFVAEGVNHKVPAVGFIVSDGKNSFAISSDTAEMDEFWQTVNKAKNLNALLIECAFPDEFEELARVSHHLTPKILQSEIEKFEHTDCPIFAINLKPMYRDEIVAQIQKLNIKNLTVLDVGKIYNW
jgi:ribonuclease BN (tRNA processing enzyme)